MAAPATTAFDLYREQVEGMVEEGQSFTEVESAIARVRLPADERDALWLLAWALRGRSRHFEPTGRSSRPVLVPVEDEWAPPQRD